MLAEVLAEVGFPERSRLISLAPIGAGTPLVECLPSYLHRLADEHWMKLYRLTALLLPHLHRHVTYGGKLRANWNNNQTALATAFSTFTKRNDLHTLTLAYLNTIISPSGMFRVHRAWCSDCLGEMGNRPHQPILWNLNAITCCNIHHRRLEEICPGCKTDLRVWGEACFAVRCPKCRTDLTKSPALKPSAWALWKSDQCCSVLTASKVPISKDRLSQILEKVLYRTFPSKVTATDAAGLGQSFGYQAGHQSGTNES